MVSTFAKATVDTSGSARVHLGRSRPTLDLELQREVQGIIAHERASLAAHGASNVAVVVLDNARGDGCVEGSGDYSDTEHGGAINGPLAPRQPGSALKPFLRAGVRTGRGPASVLPDVPLALPDRVNRDPL